ncbi:hypothetical protein [Chamaesiphon sp.]
MLVCYLGSGRAEETSATELRLSVVIVPENTQVAILLWERLCQRHPAWT